MSVLCLCLCLCQIVEGSCLRAWPVPVPDLSSPICACSPFTDALGTCTCTCFCSCSSCDNAPSTCLSRARPLRPVLRVYHRRCRCRCRRRLRTAHLAQCTAQQNVQAEQYVHARRPSPSIDAASASASAAVLYFLRRPQVENCASLPLQDSSELFSDATAKLELEPSCTSVPRFLFLEHRRHAPPTCPVSYRDPDSDPDPAQQSRNSSLAATRSLRKENSNPSPAARQALRDPYPSPQPYWLSTYL